MNIFVSLLCATALTTNCSVSNYNYYHVTKITDNSLTTLSATDENNSFILIGHSSAPVLTLECDDGYVYHYMEIYKASYTSNSDLYLAKIQNSFTPGHVAVVNGTTKTNGEAFKDYYLRRGYVHMGLSRYFDEAYYGPNISIKAMWPTSSSFSTTITSSFGFNAQFSNEFQQGVSFGDGIIIQADVGSSNSTALTINFSKTVSTTSENPFLSAQYSADNNFEAQWNFDFTDIRSAATAVTYTFNTYLLFEMDKSYYGCSRDAFILDYNIMFQGFYYMMGIFTIEGWEFFGGFRIYNFAN